ncbi:roadblock/LC7 domain-containing protein [Streptomyces tricolor]|nr:roadblock/LC7 domain-containing protein [Streptomyces tricolor]
MIVVLSADGLRIARYGGDPDAADRVAAACAGVQSLASAIIQELPDAGDMKTARLRDRGRLLLPHERGDNAHLAVLSDVTCEPGRMSGMTAGPRRPIGAHLDQSAPAERADRMTLHDATRRRPQPPSPRSRDRSPSRRRLRHRRRRTAGARERTRNGCTPSPDPATAPAPNSTWSP